MSDKDKATSTERKIYTVVDEEKSWTFLKPYSDYHKDCFICIYEDAHGEMDMHIMERRQVAMMIPLLDFQKVAEYLDTK